MFCNCTRVTTQCYIGFRTLRSTFKYDNNATVVTETGIQDTHGWKGRQLMYSNCYPI